MRHGWESEAEMAAAVVMWLETSGWDVYQEVEGPGGVGDVVAIEASSGTVMVIEAKLSMGLPVLQQAFGWRAYAHQTCVAVPWYTFRAPAGYHFGKRVAREMGIGVILASPRNGVKFEVPPTMNPEVKVERLKGLLRPQMKTYAKAGSPTGRRFTPFKETAEKVLAYVAANPGSTIKEVAAGCTHHYKSKHSFVACIPKLIEKGAVPGVRGEHDEKAQAFRLWPAEGAVVEGSTRARRRKVSG